MSYLVLDYFALNRYAYTMKNLMTAGVVLALAASSCAADTDTGALAESESGSEDTSLVEGQGPVGSVLENGIGVTYQGLYHDHCSAQQTKRLSAIATVATRFSIRTRQLLNDPAYASIIALWFGRPPEGDRSAHVSKIRDTMNAAHARLTSGNYGYDCDVNHLSCFDGAGNEFFARAQGTDTVRTCSPFWRAADAGYDSAPGTLLHELTHFAGTKDLGYGQDYARWLALSSPMEAITNADNYQYLYESLGNR